MPPVRRQVDRLPIAVAVAVIETLDTIATNPRQLGTPLRFELADCWSARRGQNREHGRCLKKKKKKKWAVEKRGRAR
jgi:hypothetical protein